MNSCIGILFCHQQHSHQWLRKDFWLVQRQICSAFNIERVYGKRKLYCSLNGKTKKSCTAQMISKNMRRKRCLLISHYIIPMSHDIKPTPIRRIDTITYTKFISNHKFLTTFIIQQWEFLNNRWIIYYHYNINLYIFITIPSFQNKRTVRLMMFIIHTYFHSH